MVNVIIVHGLGSTAEDNWFPWLKGELEKLGVDVITPAFPRTNKPNLDEWLTELHKHNKHISEETVLIAHSLGCALILNSLEFRKSSVKAVFFVAGFTGLLQDRELNALVHEFSNKEFDWDAIRSKSGKFYVVHSNNDPYVPLEKAYQLALNLATEVVVMKNSGHLTMEKFPLLLELVKKEL